MKVFYPYDRMSRWRLPKSEQVNFEYRMVIGKISEDLSLVQSKDGLEWSMSEDCEDKRLSKEAVESLYEMMINYKETGRIDRKTKVHYKDLNNEVTE